MGARRVSGRRQWTKVGAFPGLLALAAAAHLASGPPDLKEVSWAPELCRGGANGPKAVHPPDRKEALWAPEGCRGGANGSKSGHPQVSGRLRRLYTSIRACRPTGSVVGARRVAGRRRWTKVGASPGVGAPWAAANLHQGLENERKRCVPDDTTRQSWHGITAATTLPAVQCQSLVTWSALYDIEMQILSTWN